MEIQGSKVKRIRPYHGFSISNISDFTCVSKSIPLIVYGRRKPEKIITNQGTEFFNRHFKALLKDEDIELYNTYNETKASIVERLIRTLKTRMWRYFTAKKTMRYIDMLHDLVYSYNHTVHRSIKRKPVKTLCNDIPLSVTIPEDYFVDFECPANTLLYFKEISETEILRLLHGLSASKTSGMDQISARILKIASHIIVPSLTSIFNQSIRTGLFPTDWKSTKVTPIYKSGERCKMSNYRPISVISIVARIMEKLIHNQIYEYLIKSNLLSISQHGFRPLHSTCTALLDITNRWYQNMDIGQLTGVIFLDLKKLLIR